MFYIEAKKVTGSTEKYLVTDTADNTREWITKTQIKKAYQSGISIEGYDGAYGFSVVGHKPSKMEAKYIMLHNIGFEWDNGVVTDLHLSSKTKGTINLGDVTDRLIMVNHGFQIPVNSEECGLTLVLDQRVQEFRLPKDYYRVLAGYGVVMLDVTNATDKLLNSILRSIDMRFMTQIREILIGDERLDCEIIHRCLTGFWFNYQHRHLEDKDVDKLFVKKYGRSLMVSSTVYKTVKLGISDRKIVQIARECSDIKLFKERLINYCRNHGVGKSFGDLTFHNLDGVCDKVLSRQILYFRYGGSCPDIFRNMKNILLGMVIVG